MKYTQNYNLKKPEDTDPADIQDLNYNADAIDGKLKEIEDWEAAHLQASNPHSITPALIGAETPAGAQAKVDEHEQKAAPHSGHETPTGAQQKANQAETNAKSYADIVANSALNSAKDYADDVLESANSHTNQVASDLSQKVDEVKIKVLDVEQDVSNITKALTNLNPGQEAKQSISGYGILSLPKNAAKGHVSDIRILGKTIYNHADNGVDYANWSISGAGTIKGVNGIHLVADAGNDGATIPINLKNATQYTLVYYVRAKDAGDTLYIKDIISDTKIPSNIGINKCLITTDITFNRIKFFLSNSETDGKYIDFEVYAILEGDYTADSSVNKPFKFGVNSTLSGCVQRIGKNLLPTSVNDWEQGTITSTDGTNYAATNRLRPKKFYRIPTATTYKASAASGYDVRLIAWYRQDYSFIQRDTIISGNITKPADAYWYKGLIRKIDDTTIVTSDVLIAAPQIEQGSTATTREPFDSQAIYANGIFRSLPNGTNDEVGLTEGWEKQKTKEYILQASDIVSVRTTSTNLDQARISKPLNAFMYGKTNDSYKTAILESYIEAEPAVDFDSVGFIGKVMFWATSDQYWVGVQKGTTLEQAREALAGKKLIYQLAQPIETNVPAQMITAGPQHTFMWLPEVADAGIYGDDGIAILREELPIKELKKLSKIDFYTGEEISLNLSAAIIAEDKKSFTHPDLTKDDIVFFVYEYPSELSTVPEMEVEYYDSRYVVQDTENGKMYTWKIVSNNGVASIQLTEVA